MKKVIAAAAAFLAAVAPCSMFFASIEPVRASAVSETVVLSPIQTRALFGDSIDCRIYNWEAGEWQNGFFEYVSSDYSYQGFVGDWNTVASNNKHSYLYDPNSYYNNSNSPAVLYRYVGPSTSAISVLLYPTVDISNLNEFRCTFGFSSAEGISITQPDLYGSRNYGMIFTDFNSESAQNYQFPCAWYTVGNSATAYSATINLQRNIGNYTYPFNIYQLSLTNAEKKFMLSFTNPVGSDIYGVTNKDSLRTSLTPDYSNSTFYFYILPPVLSSDYVDDNDSGGGDDSSVPDSPDYSGDLQTIIDKLDHIIMQNQVFNGQLNDIDMHVQHGNSKLDQVNSNLNKIDSHIQQLQIPDLMSQSSGDMSHIAQNESKNNNDLRAADVNQQVINSVAGYGDVSLPSLENVHSMPDDFSELWNYTDQDGLSWINPLLYAMPILTLTVGALAYIVFGRAR